MAITDAQGQRTLLIGLLIGFAVYAVGFVIPFLIEGPTGQWVALAFTAVSLVFIVIWFLSVRRGFRLGSQANRMERRLKERQAEEREKLRKARMRR